MASAPPSPADPGSLADAGSSAPYRVVVADDDVLLREGIASLLSDAGYTVVGRASDARTLLGTVRGALPDLVIADIRMPPTQTAEGIEVARVIRDEFPEIGILLLSAHVELETTIDLLNSGDRIGYLLKTRILKVADLTDALDRIAAGGSVIDPAVVRELFAKQRRTDPLAVLTDREREVLALVAEGRSNNGIAHRLWISEGAVEKHVRSILSKLQLPATDEDHRRVLAVLTFLDAR
jgi:DNA-binding NarL/FixJ family response regulator